MIKNHKEKYTEHKGILNTVINIYIIIILLIILVVKDLLKFSRKYHKKVASFLLKSLKF